MDIKLNIDKKFFEEEVIYGHKVTEDVKKLWAVELDLLNELDRVCKKHGINYQLDGGSLIGAVRHNGFIPWDNDIDLMMFREDYNKFIKLANEFQHPYFLQTHETDKMWNAHARLRNSSTTCLTKWETTNKINYNKGIFIDIFPFDKVLLTELGKQTDLIKRYKNLANGTRSVSIKFPLERNIMNYFYDRYESIQTKYNNVYNAEYVANLSVIPYKDTFRKKIKDCIETIPHKFEMLDVPIPKNYKGVLEMTYPDWKTPIKGTELHSMALFDTERSYITYNLQF